MRSYRILHYLLLVLIWAGSNLPALGETALWDMDEGVNAECTREMLESGTWIVPTFNWELRTAKPVMLYWIERPFFYYFGPTEFAARLPAALLGLGSILLLYEFGRRMFDPETGLLGAIILATTIQFCMLSHAATPDAPLIFFTILAFLCFWRGHERGGRSWWVPMSIATGFAVLTKGPVGVGVPGLVLFAYFLWNRELRRLIDRRLIAATFAFLLVVGPWYGLVASETRGEWAAKFFGNENVDRFLNPKENHGGRQFFFYFYYLVAVFVMFAPWSCVIGATFWYAFASARRETDSVEEFLLSHASGWSERRAHRFLLCWFFAYFLLFTIAQTKLPNYIAPLYPALALLTARWLQLWRSGLMEPRRQVMSAAAAGVAVTGILFSLGLLLASGVLGSMKGMREFPGLEYWSWIGLAPLAASIVMVYTLRKNHRGLVVGALAFAAYLMVAITAAGPIKIVDERKAAKKLVRDSGACQPYREIRLAAYGYFKESLVFYARRKVSRGVPMREMDKEGRLRTFERPYTPDDIVDFLKWPDRAIVFVPETVWERDIAPKMHTPFRIAARHYDFNDNAEILAVTNEVK